MELSNVLSEMIATDGWRFSGIKTESLRIGTGNGCLYIVLWTPCLAPTSRERRRPTRNRQIGRVKKLCVAAYMDCPDPTRQILRRLSPMGTVPSASRLSKVLILSPSVDVPHSLLGVVLQAGPGRRIVPSSCIPAHLLVALGTYC